MFSLVWADASLSSKTSSHRPKPLRIAHSHNWAVYKVEDSEEARFFLQSKGTFYKASIDPHNPLSKGHILLSIEGTVKNGSITYDASVVLNTPAQAFSFQKDVLASLDISKNTEHVFFSFQTQKQYAFLKNTQRIEELFTWGRKTNEAFFKALLSDGRAYVFRISFLGFTSALNALKKQLHKEHPTKKIAP
jgi:hypothetical protein